MVLAVAPQVQHNLPSTWTSFVGREDEMAKLQAHLNAGARLITIAGAPGIGKTRLVQEFAASQANAGTGFESIYFIDLSGAQTALAFLEKTTEVFGIPRDPRSNFADQCAAVGRTLKGLGRVLLVFDNFEQLVDETKDILVSWLQNSTSPVSLVTSRNRLHAKVEFLLELGPLGVGKGDGDAVGLFCDRARQVDPAFGLDLDTRSLVHRICERIEGIPLAIEIVASMTDVMTLPEIAENISSLQGQHASVIDDPRYNTMKQAIAWSWNLLTPTEQDVLAQASIFVDSFRIEDLRGILPEPLKPDAITLLRTLRGKSLVAEAKDHADGESKRFYLFQSVREFGQEKLAKNKESLETRFAQHYASLARQWTEATQTTPAMQARASRHKGNLIAALGIAIGGPPVGNLEAALWILQALEVFMYHRGELDLFDSSYREVLGPKESGWREADPVLLSRSFVTAARVARRLGQFEEAFRYLDLAPQTDPDHDAAAHIVRASLLWWSKGKIEAALKSLDQVTRRPPTRLELRAEALVARAILYDHQGEIQAAQGEYESAAQLMKGCEDKFIWCVLASAYGVHLRTHGDAHRAEKMLKSAAESARSFRVIHTEIMATTSLGTLFLDQARHGEALACLERASVLTKRLGEPEGEAIVRASIAQVHLDASQHEEALRIATQAQEILSRDPARAQTLSKAYAHAGHHVAGVCGGSAWLRGDLKGCVRAYHDAVIHAEHLGEPLGLHNALVRLAASQAASGHTDESLTTLGRAGDLDCPEIGMPWACAEKVFQAHIDLASIEGALTDELETHLSALFREVFARSDVTGVVPWERFAVVRFALRTLRIPLPSTKWREWLSDALDPKGTALVISRNARFFRPPSQGWVNLSKRQKLSEFLLLLVRAHVREPSQFVTMNDVLESLWPSEMMVGDSGANRVYQVVRHLRKQGAGDVLVRGPQGYHFDEAVDILWLNQFG